MLSDQRPDPDAVLKQVQEEHTAQPRGRLKIFFGAAPGVGKTYAMLEAARREVRSGRSVLLGLVETHQRTETAALLDGLPIPYGVHPSCGASFVVHTHELVEAITDPDAGLVQFAVAARPNAWRTPSGNVVNPSVEIADICEPASVMVAGQTVAKCWSNFAQKCVGDIPLCDGTKMPPACRPCNAFDSGAACNGATPACATAGPVPAGRSPQRAPAPLAAAGSRPFTVPLFLVRRPGIAGDAPVPTRASRTNPKE